MSPADVAVIASTIVAIASALAAFLHWGLPKVKAHHDREAMKDFVIYGGIVKNPLTGRRDSEQPPLGVWMASMKSEFSAVKDDVGEVKGGLTQLSDVVSQLVEQNKATAELSGRVDRVETDVEALKTAAYERIATHAENAAALSMIEKLQGGPSPLPPKDGDSQ